MFENTDKVQNVEATDNITNVENQKDAVTESSYEKKALQIETEETELLKTLLEKQNKQLFYTRISSIAMVVFVCAIVIVCAIIVPPAVKTLNEANEAIVQAEDMISEAQASLTSINAMTDEISSAASGIEHLVDDNAVVLNSAVSQMNSIDFEGLNSAIKDLQDVVQPMANFFNKFR